MMDYRKQFKVMRNLLEPYQYKKYRLEVLQSCGFHIYILQLQIDKLKKCLTLNIK